MDNQPATSEQLRVFEPVPWEQLPDLGLYMDQVITYLEREMRGIYGVSKRIVTPAMINNYVKGGLVARPTGKKYERVQLAQLVMLCMLKQTASVEDMKLLMAVPKGESVETVYLSFCELQRSAFRSAAEALPNLSPLACAVQAATYNMLCEQLLGLK